MGSFIFIRKRGIIRFACVAATIGILSAAYGQVQESWVARHDGAGAGFDIANAVVIDSSGNVYVTGQSAGSGTFEDFLTIKYDSAGNIVWQAEYDGPGARDYATAIAVDAAGNVYVTGESEDLTAGYSYVTIKYDSAGNERWQSRFHAEVFDTPNAIFVDSSGNVYVTGRSVGPGTGRDFVTIKYDSSGTSLWVARYDGGIFDEAYAIAVDPSGNVYVTGRSWGASYDYATVMYDSSGTQVWASTYNGSGGIVDEAHAIALDGAGNVYVTGWSLGAGGNEDYATVKYNSAGVEQWVARYDGPASGHDQANALAVDSSGNVYVTGVSPGGFVTGDDYATIKYDTNGNQLWLMRYNGPGGGADGANALILDSADNVYVTGGSTGSGTGRDFATIKYDTDGNQLWAMRYDGPVSGADTANAIALDSSGNVVVTGGSVDSSSDYATVLYSQTVIVEPDSYSLFRGMLAGGGLAELLASDDTWMTVRPGITLNQAERQVQLIVTGTAPTETPTELRFRLEAHASVNNIGQWIELWNYDTSSWEEVDFMIATTVDSIVEVSITVDPGRFIEAGSKQMRAKISYKEAGIVLTFPWLISFDQTVWVIVP